MACNHDTNQAPPEFWINTFEIVKPDPEPVMLFVVFGFDIWISFE